MIEGALPQPSLIGSKERPLMKKQKKPKTQGAQNKDLR
jgi:hypothetical protein